MLEFGGSSLHLNGKICDILGGELQSRQADVFMHSLECTLSLHLKDLQGVVRKQEVGSMRKSVCVCINEMYK